MSWPVNGPIGKYVETDIIFIVFGQTIIRIFVVQTTWYRISWFVYRSRYTIISKMDINAFNIFFMKQYITLIIYNFSEAFQS